MNNGVDIQGTTALTFILEENRLCIITNLFKVIIIRVCCPKTLTIFAMFYVILHITFTQKRMHFRK